MTHMRGLLIAVALGLAGAVLNWFYLEQKSRDVEKVAFIGIANGASINRGDTLREEQLVPVNIPRSGVGDLHDFAVLWEARQTVIGRNAVRAYTGGELLLRQDLKTPPAELRLAADQRAMWIPIDTSTSVPSLIVPGDKVSFLISTADATSRIEPPRDPSSSETPTPAEKPRPATELVGPFRVLSLGNRLGSLDVMQANKIPQIQENVMTISVQVQGDALEPKAQKLWDLLRRTNFRQVGVVLHPRGEKED